MKLVLGSWHSAFPFEQARPNASYDVLKQPEARIDIETVQMDQSRWANTMDNLSLSDNYNDDETDFDSPTKQTIKSSSNTQTGPKTPAKRSQKIKTQAQDATKISESDNDSRDNVLRAELESVRRMNQVIEGVTASLEKARSNMSVRNSLCYIHQPKVTSPEAQADNLFHRQPHKPSTTHTHSSTPGRASSRRQNTISASY